MYTAGIHAPFGPRTAPHRTTWSEDQLALVRGSLVYCALFLGTTIFSYIKTMKGTNLYFLFQNCAFSSQVNYKTKNYLSL